MTCPNCLEFAYPPSIGANPVAPGAAHTENTSGTNDEASLCPVDKLWMSLCAAGEFPPCGANAWERPGGTLVSDRDINTKLAAAHRRPATPSGLPFVHFMF